MASHSTQARCAPFSTWLVGLHARLDSEQSGCAAMYRSPLLVPRVLGRLYVGSGCAGSRGAASGLHGAVWACHGRGGGAALGPTQSAREAVRRAATHGWAVPMAETVPAKARPKLLRARRKLLSQRLGRPVVAEDLAKDPVAQALQRRERGAAPVHAAGPSLDGGEAARAVEAWVLARQRPETLWETWEQYEALPYVCPYREWVRHQLETHRHESRYALVMAGGHKYRVAVGDVLHVPRVAAGVGGHLLLCKVLECGSGSVTLVGQPLVRYARVEVRVAEHLRTAKVVTVRKKPRNRRTKRHGWRHPLTALEVRAIHIDYFETGSWDEAVGAAEQVGADSSVAREVLPNAYPRFTGVLAALPGADRSIQGANRLASDRDRRQARGRAQLVRIPAPEVAHTRFAELAPRLSPEAPALTLDAVQRLAFTSRPMHPALPEDPLETGSGPILRAQPRFAKDVAKHPHSAHSLRARKARRQRAGAGGAAGS